MDAEYAALYRSLSERHWWWRARERLVLARLERLAPPAGFGPILDVGCGDGVLLRHLETWGHPEGLEPDAEIVSEETRRRWTIHLRRFEQSFDPGRRFGLITLLDVLEHLDDDVAALRHVRELCAPGGAVLVTVPALRFLWTSHDELNHHRRRYTRSSLGAAVEAAGLELVEASYFFHWLVGAKLLVRAGEAILDGRPRPPRLPPGPLNGLLYGLCRCEQETWGRLPWPLGGSLLAVLRAPP